MSSADIYNINKEKVTQIELDEKVFGFVGRFGETAGLLKKGPFFPLKNDLH